MEYQLCAMFSDHLVLGNQLMCFSLGKKIYPTLSIPWLPGVLCVALSFHGLSTIY